MQTATEASLEKLFNYGVLGIFVILLIVALIIVVRHFTKRETAKEVALVIKDDARAKEQLDLTLKFVEAVNEFKEVQKEHNKILGEMRINGVAHTELLRDLKSLIHQHT